MFFNTSNSLNFENFINEVPQNKLVSDITLNFLRSIEFKFNYMTECISKVLPISKFPWSLKLSGVVPVCKKKEPTDQYNF